MKKRLIIFGIVLIIIIGGLCTFYYVKNKDHLDFRSTFMNLNNKTFNKDKAKGKYISVDIDRDNPIIYLDDSNIIDAIKNDSRMILLGREDDNITRSILETLFKVVSDNGVEKIYYYRVYEKNKLNDKIIDAINNSDIKSLDIPVVIVINKGKIVSYHVGSVSSHSDYMKKLTDKEKLELYKIYENMVLDLIMCTDDC